MILLKSTTKIFIFDLIVKEIYMLLLIILLISKEAAMAFASRSTNLIQLKIKFNIKLIKLK